MKCGPLPAPTYRSSDVMFIQYRAISLCCHAATSPVIIPSLRNLRRFSRRADSDGSVTEEALLGIRPKQTGSHKAKLWLLWHPFKNWEISTHGWVVGQKHLVCARCVVILNAAEVFPQERDPVRKSLSFKRDQLLKHPRYMCRPTEIVLYNYTQGSIYHQISFCSFFSWILHFGQ